MKNSSDIARHNDSSETLSAAPVDLFAQAHNKVTMTMPDFKSKDDCLPGELPSKFQYPLDAIALLSTRVSDLNKSRDELTSKGRDPEPELSKIMKDVRVLGMGETHIAPNPQRELGASAMADLKSAGATHLAIEMDQARQNVLDKYMQTGVLNPKDLPEKLQTPDYLNMLDNARKANLKITAVDDHFAEEFLHINRNQTMAAYVGQILEQSPQNKVVFWVGSAHLTRFSNGEKSEDGASSAQILSSKYPVATVLAESRLHAERAPLEAITPDLNRAVIVRTSETPYLGALREDSGTNPKTWLKNYDYVIDFPEKPAKS